ncbi:MAG: ribosomal-protein-alanine N-acetyltransferase [Alphaproteobacteria bacterium PA3]|nr:MAG: ribosomal-protein-alanine N-acetyltransferase [Alphaproteobacteria bacterium PA3]
MTLRRGQVGDAPALVRIHQAAFDHPWSEFDFCNYLESDLVWVIGEPIVGFLLIRVVGDEAEILTLAVEPIQRRAGHATALLDAAKQDLAKANVSRLFLEVAADNSSALALYERQGFAQIGIRKGYYRRDPGPNMDARLFSCVLPAAH